jgi:CRISPR type I-E-associated protein CasB/Cse2
VSPTEEYIARLRNLKGGDLGLLRAHAGQGLDESLDGFDLFAGLWWPLRAKSERAPRRGVAWLIAKLYAFRPIEHSPGHTLAWQLGRCREDKGPNEDAVAAVSDRRRRSEIDATIRPVAQRFDRMLALPLAKIEPALQWAINLIATKGLKLDWVELTNDLSFWERQSKRLKWANEFLKSLKEERHAN